MTVTPGKLRGFTLFELIMMLAIAGVLAVYIMPRFISVSVYQTRGFTDQVQAALRYAQKEAIAQRRVACANYSAAPARLTLKITVSTTCDTALNLPGSNLDYIEAPAGVSFTMTPSSVNFDALGRPGAAVVASVDTTTISVEAETGYVHQ